MEIVAERIPTRQHRLILDRAFEQAQRRCLGDFSAAIVASVRPSRRSVSALDVEQGPIPPNSETSFFASGLVSTRGMVSVSRYSTSS